MNDNNTIDKAKDIYVEMDLSVDDNKYDFCQEYLMIYRMQKWNYRRPKDLFLKL